MRNKEGYQDPTAGRAIREWPGKRGEGSGFDERAGI